MSRDRAAYMREYRKRQKSGEQDGWSRAALFERIRELEGQSDAPRHVEVQELQESNARIRALEEEVRHLKAELAKRPVRMLGDIEPRPAVWLDEDYAKRPVRAVPKRPVR